jgi:hypothetical protein
METIKQTVKVPENHELKIKIPSHIPTDEETEIVLHIKKKNTAYKAKIAELKKSKTDKLFLEDLQNDIDDFKAVDAEGLQNQAYDALRFQLGIDKY